MSDEDGWFLVEGVPLATYHTIAATVPRGALLVPADGSGPMPVPYIRGAYALRVNVAVTNPHKPLIVGALFVSRPYHGGGPVPLPLQPDAAPDGSGNGQTPGP
jgi:hypothetical protein